MASALRADAVGGRARLGRNRLGFAETLSSSAGADLPGHADALAPRSARWPARPSEARRGELYPRIEAGCDLARRCCDSHGPRLDLVASSRASDRPGLHLVACSRASNRPGLDLGRRCCGSHRPGLDLVAWSRATG